MEVFFVPFVCFENLKQSNLGVLLTSGSLPLGSSGTKFTPLSALSELKLNSNSSEKAGTICPQQ